MGSVWSVLLLAIIAFGIVGMLLCAMILFAKTKLVSTALRKIFINEDDDKTFEVEGGETLLNALLKNGYGIPSPCGGKATCLQCKVRVKEGGGEPMETDASAFSHKELIEGWRLSCQCKVKDDIKVELDESQCSMKEILATVVRNDNIATFIKELEVEISEEIAYQPGDYLQFHVPPFSTNTNDWKATIDSMYQEDWNRFDLFNHEIHVKEDDVIRAYSLASFPKEGNRLKFHVRIASPPLDKKQKTSRKIPWGICSSYIFSLKSGDEVTLSGPHGESHMIEDDRDLYFLIGGAGSSFSRSHIGDLLLSKKTKRKIDFWYGARSMKEKIYHDFYLQLEKEYSNFSYHLVLSEPLKEDLLEGWPEDDPTKTGFLFKAFEEGALKKMPTPEDNLYFICGPPMHNQSLMQLLDDYGVDRDSIILDDFGN